MVDVINGIREDRIHYKFNVIGLIGVAIHFKFKKEKCFYCAEFVKYVLEQSKAEYNLPEFIKPEDFKEINGLDVVYSGVLNEYNS